MAEAETADIFLFLLSADFLASRYCYEIEMARALEREEAGEATILPVVLHSCEWLHSDLGKFTAVPKDGKPIAKHSYPEDAYVEVASGIRRLVSERQKTIRKATTSAPAPGASCADARPVDPIEVVREAPPPRSSNLAIRKEFSDADRHAFLEGGFEFIANFFEESLAELGRRNPGVDGRYRRNGADAFTARVFMQGKQEAQCRVMLGGMFGNGISFSHDADARIGSSNEQVDREDRRPGTRLRRADGGGLRPFRQGHEQPRCRRAPLVHVHRTPPAASAITLEGHESTTRSFAFPLTPS